MIFVDEMSEWANGSGSWCHMATDSDIEELHLFAEKIGLKRAWFQDKKIPHYDLRESKRKLAVKNGAIEITAKELYLKITKKTKELN